MAEKQGKNKKGKKGKGKKAITPPPVDAIETVEEFLAHACALENEMAERYDELADSLEVHNNPETAALFRKLAGFGQKHAEEMMVHAAGKELPRIAPWDFKWGGGASPEAASLDGMHYMMTPYHALELARDAEAQAQTFYADVASATSNKEVRKLAKEFAEEEGEHVELVDEWLSKIPEPEEGWDEDPDPPNMPE